MSTEFFRKYIDIINEANGTNEAVRGMFYDPGSVNMHGVVPRKYTRPETQADRDVLAKGLKTARTYNQAIDKDARTPDENPSTSPDDSFSIAGSRGALSGSIRTAEPAPGGKIISRKGMPAKMSSDPKNSEPAKWQTAALNTINIGKPGAARVVGPVKANQGKPGTGKPAAPF